MSGGGGNDYLIGGHEHDRLIGGKGDDTLIGNDGWDSMRGEDGHDAFIYQAGQTKLGDFIDGGEGYDRVVFESGAGTTLSVSAKDASFRNIEEILGGQGHDKINASGLSGSFAMAGHEGNDSLEGAAGRDQLQGNGGHDRLIGGDGDDIFVFGGNSGTWTVADFTRGVDHIWIDTPVTVDFTYILEHAVEVDGNTQISIGDKTMIVGRVGIADLQASDFFFQ